MGMHRIVNGVKVDLTPEEEHEVNQEWIANMKAKKERAKVAEKREKDRQSALDKIYGLAGLSEDEIKALRL